MDRAQIRLGQKICHFGGQKAEAMFLKGMFFYQKIKGKIFGL